MEITISRDRWQLHMKTRGQHYHSKAAELEALHARYPNVGADIAALALHALAEVLEHARLARLTRHQHILMRLGELIAYGEGADAVTRRAITMAEGKLHEKADKRFNAGALALISRIYAREAAMKVAADGLKWIVGAEGVGEIAKFEQAIRLSAINRAQAGLLMDMDALANIVYAREEK